MIFWLLEPTEPQLVNGEWRSVYRMNLSKLPTQDDILKSFEAEDSTLSDSEPVARSRARTSPLLISEALGIEEKQRELRALIDDKSTSPDDIENRRSSLMKIVKQWRKKYIKLVPLLEDKIATSSDAESIEKEALHLPSDFSPQERKELGLSDLSHFELKLREGQANAAITGICNCLTHENLLVGFQRKHSRGVKQNTRSHKIINRIRAKRNGYAACYRHARLRLLALSNLGSKDSKRLDGFPELKNDDMYQKNAADVRVLGEGKETDSWIWSYGNLRGLDDGQRKEFLNEVKKVHWFRTRADMMRWVEEVEILEEDFRRLVRAAESMAAFWTSVNASDQEQGPWNPVNVANPSRIGYVVYAQQKAAMYRKMASNAREGLKSAGGEWPREAETVAEYAQRRRPDLSINWENAEGYLMEEEVAE
ncbi:hypothetical protein MD484_g6700, partial [Candolleomyces efflorescens]